MNEEELKKEINGGIDYANPNRVWKAIGDLEDLSFQKGKLEERERIREEIRLLRHLWDKGNCNDREKECLNYACDRIEEQLQKEIGDEK